jgi:hypothetical protein
MILRSRICTAVAFLGLAALPVTAQSGGLHGPIAGFVYHRASHTVRPLVGVPGATYAGSPVLRDVDAAWVSPSGKWAVITKSGDAALVRLSGLDAGQPSTSELIPNADRVVWSRDGGDALLYSSRSNELQVVHVSANQPAADAPLDLSPWGAVGPLAIDPAGRMVAFGVAGVGLYIIEASHVPALVSDIHQPVAAAFDENGRLYAVDDATRRLLQFDPGGAGGFEFASLAAPEDGSAVDTAGLAVSAGGRYLMLADRASRTVRVYDTASRALNNVIGLDFAPTRMEAISPGPVFLLNGDNRNEWLLLLDARNTPSTYFVPASEEDGQ